LGAGAALLLSQIPEQIFANSIFKFADIPIGFQTFPIRTMLGQDFEGTLKTMSGFGYKLVELCSPQGYAGIGFKFLADKKPAEIRKTINDAGLSCPSCHFVFNEMTDKIDDRIEFAHELGLTQMI